VPASGGAGGEPYDLVDGIRVAERPLEVVERLDLAGLGREQNDLRSGEIPPNVDELRLLDHVRCEDADRLPAEVCHR
jgi:hypothetical protein